MPRWDLECQECGRVYPDMVFQNIYDREGALRHIICEHPCRGRLQVKLSAANFTITGYNAKNGYSK